MSTTPPPRRRVQIHRVLILVVFAAVLVLVGRQRLRDERMRSEVYRWIRSMAGWDAGKTEAANFRRTLEGLRSLGDGAVRILESDLNERGAIRRLVVDLPVVGKLIPSLGPGDDAEAVRSRAAYYLGELGPAARSAVPRLLRCQHDPDAAVRFEAAFALGRIGEDSPEVRQVLTGWLTDASPQVRFSAACSLWVLDRADGDAAAEVESRERMAGMITATHLSWPSLCLIKLGPEARAFGPHLATLIRDLPWSMARAQAVHALWAITGDRRLVEAEFDSVERELGEASKVDPVTGWSAGETVVGYMVTKLDDDAGFRARMSSLLRLVLRQPDTPAHRMATVYLRRFADWDRENGGGGKAPEVPAVGVR